MLKKSAICLAYFGLGFLIAISFNFNRLSQHPDENEDVNIKFFTSASPWPMGSFEEYKQQGYIVHQISEDSTLVLAKGIPALIICHSDEFLSNDLYSSGKQVRFSGSSLNFTGKPIYDN